MNTTTEYTPMGIQSSKISVLLDLAGEEKKVLLFEKDNRLTGQLEINRLNKDGLYKSFAGKIFILFGERRVPLHPSINKEKRLWQFKARTGKAYILLTIFDFLKTNRPDNFKALISISGGLK